MTDEQIDEVGGGAGSQAEHAILVLGTDCTIREAVELKNQLVRHLNQPEPLFVDGSGVEKADTAGVQLLVAFSLDCMERGIRFGWPGRSEALDKAINALGVGALLECPGEVAVPPAAYSGATS